MQNFIQKFRQSSIVSEKPGNLFKKLKTFENSNWKLNNFCGNSKHVPYLPVFTKECAEFF